MTSSYPRPPIVEAVIEFRFAGVGTQKDLETATKRFRTAYPRLEEMQQLQVTVEMAGGRASAEPVGVPMRKMTSADGADVVMLGLDSVTAARLAPYPGWEHLEGKLRASLGLARSIVKKRRLTRIGMRFINRIDILADSLGTFDHSEYVTIGTNLMPLDDIPILGMSFSVSSLLDHGRFGVIVNCGKVASPVLDHAGLLLDIEVYNQANLPAVEEDIWAQVNEIRMWKNKLFEASLTDKARELFI